MHRNEYPTQRCRTTRLPDLPREAFEETHGRRLELRNYIQYLAAQLDLLATGEVRRLCINLPPRHLKTEMMVAFMAYSLGHDPQLRILVLSFNESLAKYIASNVRKIMRSVWYREAFATRIAADRGEVTDFETTKGGGLFASWIGSGFTGRGAELIVIDDPVDLSDANNLKRLEEVNQTVSGPVMSRLNNPKDGRVVLIAHRLNEQDLTGHLLGKKKWRHIALPLIAPQKEVYRISETKVWERKAGELLRPDAFSKAVLKELQQPTYPSFETLYQQDVAHEKQLRIEPEHFKTFTRSARPTGPVVLSVDPGFAAGPKNSFSVIQALTRHEGVDRLLEQWRAQAGYDDVLSRLRSFNKRYRPSRILIERTGFGSALCEFPRFEKVVEAIIPDGRSKLERLRAHTQHIRKGGIALPEGADFRDAFVDEFVDFAATLHTDQVDATTQYLDFMATSPSLKAPPPAAIGVATMASTGEQRSVEQQSGSDLTTPGFIGVTFGSRFDPFQK